MYDLIHLPEPSLQFRYDQAMLDPRDGLSLFGPLDRAKPDGIRWAVVGPKDSIRRMKAWVRKIQKPVLSSSPVARPLFPGFEAAFGAKWNPEPVLAIEVPDAQLRENAHLSDGHQRVFRTVDMYASLIIRAKKTEDATADLWCVVIPEYVYRNCRPRSVVAADVRVQSDVTMTSRQARELAHQPSLFQEQNALSEEYLYEVNFHHQLKARLLKDQIPIQIVREIKVAEPDEFLNAKGERLYDFTSQQSAIAWNISTAVFYKAGGRPWKLGAGRPGVCYIGLVFKQDERDKRPGTACCAAQMFLDSGDGVVFKGAVGPWYRGKRGLFHLDRKSARQVVQMCIDAYAGKHDKNPPAELFIHGRIELNDDEWAGFREAAGTATKVVGVRIQPVSGFKLFRKEDHPILRGLAYCQNNRRAFLWTRGLIPRLRTYVGREVPNPILVDVCRGDADLKVVLADVLALTKLNYNSCTYADGLPVTLKFANAVGEVLTAGPAKELDVPPLPFKFYI